MVGCDAARSAQEYCETLDYSGTGWRLPTLSELFSLVDQGNVPAVAPAALAVVNGDYDARWAASPYRGNEAGAWVVLLSNGSTGGFNVHGAAAVLCVR